MNNGINGWFFHNFSAFHADKIVEKIPFSCYLACLASKISLFVLFCGLAGFARATELYHTNRVFNKVTFTIPGVPTAFEVYNMAGQLTTVVGPTNVITNSFYATERQSVPLGHASSAQAWDAAVAGYPASCVSSNSNCFYDNAGWVKGVHQTADGKWGGYIWLLQNTMNFKTSETNIWISTNGVTNVIFKVLVGTIGDYAPMAEESDTGPTVEGLTNNPPTGGSSDNMTYMADFTAYYDIGLPVIRIEPLLTNVCVNSGNVTFWLITNSYVASVNWSITPEGLTNGAGLTNYASYAVVAVGGVATSYVVKAMASNNTNVFGSAVLNVVNVELNASKNLLTLKHDRECNLEVKTVPVDISAEQYKIEIKRTNSATWYTLSTNKTMTPWLANIAGGFHLRSMAKISGTECYSTNIVVVNQFPNYTQIEDDSGVRSATDTEWTNTLTDCTENPNQRRERGFWIQINTTSNIYEHTVIVTGEWAGATNDVGVNLSSRPADNPVNPLPNEAGAVYPIASFHTHTPTTYRTNYPPGSTRNVGPSPDDNTADTAQDVPGLVYDYTESPAGSGSIPIGYPENSSAQRYQSMGKTRRTTP